MSYDAAPSPAAPPPGDNRHGNVVWYVRVGKGPRIRIKGIYGTPEFEAAYRAAINGEVTTASAKGAKGLAGMAVDALPPNQCMDRSFDGNSPPA